MQHQQRLIGRRGVSLLTRLQDGLKINLSPFWLVLSPINPLSQFEQSIAPSFYESRTEAVIVKGRNQI